MSLNYEKAWQFDMNRAFTSVTAHIDAERYTAWYYKAFLCGQIGGATQGLWTVVGSSDGSTAGMDGVDRWGSTFNPAKIVISNATRSWVCLRSPAMLGNTYYMIIDLANTVPGIWDAYLFIYLDITLPTGGTTSAIPTMTAGVRPASNTGCPYCISTQGSSVRPGPIKIHGMLAPDGSFIILTSKDYTNCFYSGFVGMLLANYKPANQYPFMISLAGDPTLASLGFGSGWGPANTFDHPSYNCMRTPNGVGGMISLGMIKPVTTNFPDGPNAFDGFIDNWPIWFGSNATGTNTYRTIVGRVPDMFYTPVGADYADALPTRLFWHGMVDNQSSPKWMIVGNMIIPTNAIPIL